MKKEKLSALALIVCLISMTILYSINPNPIYAEVLEQPNLDAIPVMDTVYDNGSAENPEDPSLISTKEDLYMLAEDVNKGTILAGQYYILMENIDLADEIWTPIGLSEVAPFEGNFDFNGKVVSNYRLNPDTNMDTINGDVIDVRAEYGGLFGVITKDATITGYAASSENVLLDSTVNNVPIDNMIDDFDNNINADNSIDNLMADNLTANALMDSVTEAEPVAGSDKAITSFTFDGLNPQVTGVIDEAAKTVKFVVPFGIDLTALMPTIAHSGAGISPASGTEQNFTGPVAYTVTADDGSTQEYIVTVDYPPTRIETGSGNTSYAGEGAVAVDPGLVISSDNLDGAKVMIENMQVGDVLGYTGDLPSGVESGTWNEITGILTFEGLTSAENWQNLLRSVTFHTTSDSTDSRTVTFSLGTALPGNNGHYYEYVQGSISWTEAKANASAHRYFGMQGYLVTITSAEENELICQRLQADAWIGASDAKTEVTTEGAIDGDWYWVTGPEKGIMFSKGNGNPMAQNEMYTNWYKNPLKPYGPWEPNNWDGDENYGTILSVGNSVPGTWNDVKVTNATIKGYVVEYGGMTGDPELQLSASKTIDINRTYIVTFVNWDDSELKKETVYYGGGATAPDNPSRPADEQYTYTFNGWDKEFNNITGNLTVKATYKTQFNNYTVTFVDWDNSVLKEQMVNYGSEATAPANPTRPADAQYTYTFDKWDKAFTNITDNLTVKATYKTQLNSYTVVFVDWDNSVLKTETVNYSSSATAPSNPSREGYTFSGWDKTFDNVTFALTIKAIYTINLYTVSYHSNGATAGTVPFSTAHEYNSTVTAAANSGNITKKGYTLTGWNTKVDGTGDDYAAGTGTFTIGTSDVILYAKWSIIAYNISYSLNGGTNYNNAPTSYSVESETIDLGIPQKTGYTFVGWYNSATEGDQITQIPKGSTGNRTLYARWIPNTNTAYKVNHYQQSVEGDRYILKETENLTETTDKTANAEAKNYPGFSENMSHVGRVASGTILGDGSLILNLYYDRNTYTVSFDNNGGSAVDNITGVRYEAQITQPANPTREGYSFTDWYSDPELTNTFDFNSVITGDITLYAKWNLITYTVAGTIRDNAGFPITGVTVTLTDLADSSKMYQVTTDINGSYTTNVPDGSYAISVTNGSDTLGTGSVTVDGSDAADGSGDIVALSPTSYTVSGDIVDDTGKSLSDVKIKLMAGSKQVGSDVTTDVDGKFSITNVPNGVYNLIVSNELTSQTITLLITVVAENKAIGTVTLPKGKNNSVIEVKDGTPDVIVGNLNDFFLTENNQYTSDDKAIVDGGGTVEIKLTVEMKNEEDATNALGIKAAAGSRKAVGIFLDLSLSKAVTPSVGPTHPPILIRELEEPLILDIPLPAELQGKSGYVIYRYHDGVDLITEQANSDGEKIEVSPDGKSLKLYSMKFSTYAIAYTVTVNSDNDQDDDDSTRNKLPIGVNRLAGANRIDTALAIAKASYEGKVSGVILATAENYPDALVGSVLAYKLKAPILLVGSTKADQEKVLAYLKNNLNPEGKVYILGGNRAVSEAMVIKIRSLGFQDITRLNGRDRYETAGKIADSLKVSQGTPIVLVSGENYPDALSVSSAAAIMQSPVLLVQKDRINEVVSRKIAEIQPAKVYIIGDEKTISTEVETRIRRVAFLDQKNIIRIDGSDRYNTSLAIANYFNLPGKLICVASGDNFPDTLAGSIYAAKNKASIILIDRSLSDDQINYLKTRTLRGVTLFGGEDVIGIDIEQQLGQLIGD